jgi:hypothetical protein
LLHSGGNTLKHGSTVDTVFPVKNFVADTG